MTTLFWKLYIIQSQTTGKLYTGISPDPYARVQKHNNGKGAKATRAGRPWVILYVEPIGPKGAALKREAQIKRMPRGEKLAIAGLPPS